MTNVKDTAVKAIVQGEPFDVTRHSHRRRRLAQDVF